MKWFKVVSLSTLLLGLSAGVFFYAYSLYIFQAPGPLVSDKIIFIHKGSGFSTIIRKLDQEGMINHPLLFEFQARLKGLSSKIRAGEFQITKASSPQQILDHLISGPVVQHAITIAEGLTAAEIISLIQEAPLLDKSEIPKLKEGETLPETYHYTWNETAQHLVDRMKQAMDRIKHRAWHEKHASHILKTPEDLIILASIVEKETSLENERAHIAGVFLNRLKRGMPLQSDPTIIYGLEQQRGAVISELSRQDLAIPSKYNTYLQAGLPPTPICSPGKASIQAVAHPLKTDDLYFVADGTGGHIFARTYAEHAENHQKWRKIRNEKAKSTEKSS